MAFQSLVQFILGQVPAFAVSTSCRDKPEVLQVVTKECCVGELVEYISDDLPSFHKLVRVKRIQEAELESDKKTARVVQIDFAMAYQCEYQDEVQSALWSRQSVTLVTVAVFHQSWPDKVSSSVLIPKNKDKTSMLAFNA